MGTGRAVCYCDEPQAEVRGMSGFGLFELLILAFVALLFLGGAVGVVVIVIVALRRRPDGPAVGLVPCAACGHYISPVATACPKCGHPTGENRT